MEKGINFVCCKFTNWETVIEHLFRRFKFNVRVRYWPLRRPSLEKVVLHYSILFFPCKPRVYAIPTTTIPTIEPRSVANGLYRLTVLYSLVAVEIGGKCTVSQMEIRIDWD